MLYPQFIFFYIILDILTLQQSPFVNACGFLHACMHVFVYMHVYVCVVCSLWVKKSLYETGCGRHQTFVL